MGLRELIGRIRGRGDEPLGVRGERYAAEFLKRELGMRILARNVACPQGELDIVALDGEELVFVEVRTRATDAFGAPEDSIQTHKRATLRRAARWFIKSRRLGRYRVRIDAIGVIWTEGAAKPVVRYVRGAFRLQTR